MAGTGVEGGVVSGTLDGYHFSVFLSEDRTCICFEVSDAAKDGAPLLRQQSLLPPLNPDIEQRKRKRDNEKEDKRKRAKNASVATANPVATIAVLPHETLDAVFSFLPLEAVGSVLRVCKVWKSICSTEAFWRRLFVRDFGPSTLLFSSAKAKVKHVSLRWQYDKDLLAVQWRTVLGLKVDPELFENVHDKELRRVANLAAFAGNGGVALESVGRVSVKETAVKDIASWALQTGNEDLFRKAAVRAKKYFKYPSTFTHFLRHRRPLQKVARSRNRALFERVMNEATTSTPSKKEEPIDYTKGVLKIVRTLASANSLMTLNPEQQYPLSNAVKAEALFLATLQPGGVTLSEWIMNTQQCHGIPQALTEFMHVMDLVEKINTLVACIYRTRDWRAWAIGDVVDAEDEEQNPALKAIKKLLQSIQEEGTDFLNFSSSCNLVDKSSDEILEETTPLKCAASYAPLWVIKLLLDEPGVNIDAVGVPGSTALMGAVLAKRTEVVRFLLAEGASVVVTDEKYDRTADAWKVAAKGKHFEIVAMLLQALREQK